MSCFTRLSMLSRRHKLALFYKTFQPHMKTRILDLGAEINPNGDRGLQLIDSYPWKSNLTAVNVDEAHVYEIKKHYPQINAVVGDACRLPWPDKHFDIVYSNAVIEHVGDLASQRKMASEIMRVAKRWFVTTPNRWYPFEFHLRLPLVTWLWGDTYLQAARLVRYDHERGRYTFMNPKAEFRLLSQSDMKTCFPGSRILRQRITFMAETLIAVGGYGKISWGENVPVLPVQKEGRGDRAYADPRLRAMSIGVPEVCGAVAGSGQAGAESIACEST